MHQQSATVTWGYILTRPFLLLFRVIALILLVWSTHAVVWRELHHRFTKPRVWFHVGTFQVLILWLLGMYYFGLELALACAWLAVMQVNVVADVATKRAGFELSFAVFVFIFATFVLAGASISLCIHVFMDKRKLSTDFPKVRAPREYHMCCVITYRNRLLEPLRCMMKRAGSLT